MKKLWNSPWRKWLPTLLFPLGVGLTRLARIDPYATDRYFSQTVYPVVMGAISTLTAPLPFALIEWILALLPVVALVWLWRGLRPLVKADRAERLRRLAAMAATLSGVLAGVYFLFVISCGLNYHRLPFTHYSGLTLRDSSAQELYDLCAALLEETNAQRQTLREDEQGLFVLKEQNMYRLAREAEAAFDDLALDYPVLRGSYAPPKPLFFSEVLSQMNLLGNFSSYTGEPCINVAAPGQNIPATMCHELAHQRGFMREDEANFLSYLACVRSQNPDFRYSGLLRALVYSTNALYGADRELFFQLRAQYSPGLERDLEAEAAYWRRYSGKVSKAANRWNDTYLKANSQSDGVESYGRMVDLLLAEYRQRHGVE